jgi:serine/threonine protein kinase
MPVPGLGGGGAAAAQVPQYQQQQQPEQNLQQLAARCRALTAERDAAVQRRQEAEQQVAQRTAECLDLVQQLQEAQQQLAIVTGERDAFAQQLQTAMQQLQAALQHAADIGGQGLAAAAAGAQPPAAAVAAPGDQMPAAAAAAAAADGQPMPAAAPINVHPPAAAAADGELPAAAAAAGLPGDGEDVVGPVLLDMMGNPPQPPDEWDDWEGDEVPERRGQYGSIQICWVPADGHPRLAAVKCIGLLDKPDVTSVTPADLERLHSEGVPQLVQLDGPGLMRTHGSYLLRDEQGVPDTLLIVMEPLVGRWADLSTVLRWGVVVDATHSNIFWTTPAGGEVPLLWHTHSLPGKLLKRVWDHMLQTLKHLQEQGLFMRDVKPANMFLDVLSCAADFGEDSVPPEVLQRCQEAYQQLVMDILAKTAGEDTDSGSEDDAAGPSSSNPPNSSSTSSQIDAATAAATAAAAGVRGPGATLVGSRSCTTCEINHLVLHALVTALVTCIAYSWLVTTTALACLGCLGCLCSASALDWDFDHGQHLLACLLQVVFADQDDVTDADHEKGLISYGDNSTAAPEVMRISQDPDLPNSEAAAAQAAKTPKAQMFCFAKAFLQILINCEDLMLVGTANPWQLLDNGGCLQRRAAWIYMHPLPETVPSLAHLAVFTGCCVSTCCSTCIDDACTSRVLYVSLRLQPAVCPFHCQQTAQDSRSCWHVALTLMLCTFWMQCAEPGALERLLLAVRAPAELIEVLLGCLHPDPEQRLDVTGALGKAFSSPTYTGMNNFRRPLRVAERVVLHPIVN